jgi:hypothetical protein
MISNLPYGIAGGRRGGAKISWAIATSWPGPKVHAVYRECAGWRHVLKDWGNKRPAGRGCLPSLAKVFHVGKGMIVAGIIVAPLWPSG